MKDLKHLLYFENLLQEAHNDLVAQAQNEGKICVAYACENTPEPLLNLPGAFSTRLRAPRTGSMEMATYYMTSFLCEYSRALLERAIEGGYNFADCMITPDGCSMMNRAVENMELLKTMGKSKPKFFYEYMEIPMKADDNGLNLYVLQCRNHILTPLHEHYGIDVSDAAIRSAVAEHNHVCELIRAIGEYRKGDNPRITGYEFHVITLATYVAPKYLLIDKLEETLKELKTRRPDKKNPYRARVVVVGSEVDDIDFIKLVEDTGAYVCADRFCYGSFPGRDPITLTDDEDALTQICRQYCTAVSARAIWICPRCSAAANTSTALPRSMRPTASSMSRSSSATRGRMSVCSARTFSTTTTAIRCCLLTARITSLPPARCAPVCRHSWKAWRSRRFKGGNSDVQQENRLRKFRQVLYRGQGTQPPRVARCQGHAL